MKITNLLRNKNSQVLITAIIVIALVLVIGASLLFHGRSFRNISALQKKTNSAYSLAKSGLEIAERKINTSVPPPQSDGSCNPSPGGPGGSGSGDITQTTFNVDSGGEITISATNGAVTSIGKIDGATQVLTKNVPIPTGVTGPAGEPVTTWANSYGEAGGTAERANTVIKTTDGKFLFAGHTDTWGTGRFDIALVKTNVDGSVLWAKAYGQSNYERIAQSHEGILYEVPAGGYIIGGYSDSFGAASSKTSPLALRVDPNGGVIWAYVYSITGDETLINLQLTYATLNGSHNGYLLVGAKSESKDVGLLINIDTTGTVKANGNKKYTYNSLNDSLVINSAQQVFNLDGSPNGYILTGYVTGAPNTAFLVMKTDTDGNVGSAYSNSWAYAYGISTRPSQANVIQKTTDGDYIIGGYTGKLSTTSPVIDISPV